ncbi:DoxX family protein [Aquipuribacter nitratireducens]|uniref:DoxX family protein n=1 Tax=Aquipuribacter nitratireducens TaxID=650104 RepID=A0ABW0GNV4_9MICO
MFRRIARPLLAAVFVHSGVDALRDPSRPAERAAPLVKAAAERFGIPDDPVLAARVNGGVMVAGGLGMATGVLPRTSALALAASLVPTTYAGHAFWEYPKEEQKQHRIQFLKNLGLLSGLLLVADAPYAQERAVRKAKRARKAEAAAAQREKQSKAVEKAAAKQAKHAAKIEARAAKQRAKAEKADARLRKHKDD